MCEELASVRIEWDDFTLIFNSDTGAWSTDNPAVSVGLSLQPGNYGSASKHLCNWQAQPGEPPVNARVVISSFHPFAGGPGLLPHCVVDSSGAARLVGSVYALIGYAGFVSGWSYVFFDILNIDVPLQTGAVSVSHNTGYPIVRPFNTYGGNDPNCENAVPYQNAEIKITVTAKT